MRALVLATLFAFVPLACSRSGERSSSRGVEKKAAATTELPGSCTDAPQTADVEPGVRVTRVRAPSTSAGTGDGCITLVRIDPTRQKLRLLSAASEGGRRRTAEQWSDEFHLTGAINASMYTEDGHSVTMMVNGPVVNQPRDDKRYGGFFAFDPTREGIPPVAAFGRECAGFDLAAIRHDYKVVVQNYRLLDCEAHAISWKDPKVVSAAAIGIGKDGDVVFIHTRTAHTMTELATILGMPALSLAHAHYVEGGPEASLYVHAGNRTIRAIGQYTGAFADDVSQQLWELPNVIGFSPR